MTEKILITGNLGYIGPVLTSHLRTRYPNLFLAGFDNAYFSHHHNNPLHPPQKGLNCQWFGDVRNLKDDLIKQFDSIVHLAAISNDPIGAKFEQVTDEINHLATVSLCERAMKLGLKNFVFASSCSVYGQGEGAVKKEGDALNPLTAYAKSKIAAEAGLKKIPLSDNQKITCLRFSTACGASDHIRLDLVLNDFVACALTQRNISILSDGSPWRPLINVKDMSRAIEWALTRSAVIESNYLSVNIGSKQWHYQVHDLANAVAKTIPGTVISINPNAQPDKRSYQVDFSLFESLAPDHQPINTLEKTIAELLELLQLINFNNQDFRHSNFIRLKVLNDHLTNNRLNEKLEWKI